MWPFRIRVATKARLPCFSVAGTLLAMTASQSFFAYSFTGFLARAQTTR